MATSDEIFRLESEQLEALPARSLKEGWLGKNLEDALQALLEEHPNLIPGRQVSASDDTSPHFVLLRREMPIRNWSLDHLFSDQFGVPTLVEAKLIQNPESRREVIGQIIEYAANSAELWSKGQAKSYAEDYYRNKDLNLSEALTDRYGENFDVDQFWSSFESNLVEGKIRLIIAADQIRPEVRRMIEFLNWEMSNVEVLGLEISCYGNDEHSLVIVPRIIGQSQAAADRKSVRTKGVKWTEERVVDAIKQLDPETLRGRLKKIFDLAIDNKAFVESKALDLRFGLKNQYDERQVDFAGDGGAYIYLSNQTFKGDKKNRNYFFEEFRSLGLVKGDEKIEEIKDGRWFAKQLHELSGQEFKKLFTELEKVATQDIEGDTHDDRNNNGH